MFQKIIYAAIKTFLEVIVYFTLYVARSPENLYFGSLCLKVARSLLLAPEGAETLIESLYLSME